MTWYFWVFEFFLVYWVTIFFHELGHYFLIKCFRVPYVMRWKLLPFGIYFHYKSTNRQAFLITISGVLNGLGWLMTYYMWGGNTVILYLNLVLYTMGCGFDFWKTTQYTRPEPSKNPYQ